MRVLDVVMMGHTEMWAAMQERDAIYANPDATDDDYMKAAELEGKVAEYDGYTAEARAGELLLGAGVSIDQHQGPMSNVRRAGSCACCWRRRCSRIRTSCCSTSRPTTWTSTPFAGWKTCSTSATPP
jgi:hypothetical protein